MSGVAPAAIRARSGGSSCIGRLLQRVVDNGHQGVAYPCFGAVDTRFIAEPFRRRRRAVVTAIGHAARQSRTRQDLILRAQGATTSITPALASVVPV
ncbi:hypothetical protein DF046_27045 [Burkholderia cepacia]|uniref:hypothetical protein n=1 Tax=Burkholderia cepacia TaxID=292 RepID=UPI000F5A8CBB|nr:hypothetical protein [Burkholderia cepacia]RQT47633.1 hypothetical protein DF046_27045 [Burkholderia cepacia]RQZ88912.1 hypothetical protein DF053_11900 [Burkholderia cepacia]